MTDDDSSKSMAGKGGFGRGYPRKTFSEVRRIEAIAGGCRVHGRNRAWDRNFAGAAADRGQHRTVLSFLDGDFLYAEVAQPLDGFERCNISPQRTFIVESRQSHR